MREQPGRLAASCACISSACGELSTRLHHRRWAVCDATRDRAARLQAHARSPVQRLHRPPPPEPAPHPPPTMAACCAAQLAIAPAVRRASPRCAAARAARGGSAAGRRLRSGAGRSYERCDARGRRTTGPPAHRMRSRRPPCARSAARASMAGVARPCAARALRCVSASLPGAGCSRIGCHTGGDCSSRSFSRAVPQRARRLQGTDDAAGRVRAQAAALHGLGPARPARACPSRVCGEGACCAAPRTKAAGLSRRRRRRAWRSCRLRPWARRLPRLPQPASSSPWWCVSALP